jgi:hypothetical protein
MIVSCGYNSSVVTAISQKSAFTEVSCDPYIFGVFKRIIRPSALIPKTTIVTEKTPIASWSEGNGLILSQGLLNQLRYEDDLAFILAHEWCHILLHNNTNIDIEKERLRIEIEADYCALERVYNAGFCINTADSLLTNLMKKTDDKNSDEFIARKRAINSLQRSINNNMKYIRCSLTPFPRRLRQL